MAPPDSLNLIGQLNAGMGTALGDPADTTEYEHGVSAPFRKSGMLLRESQQIAEENAMEKLQKALQSQPSISPSQGIAAALLAAIPTLGGYMIGQSVGRPNIPEGTYFKGLSPQGFNQEFGVGGSAAAAQGAAIGQESSQGYIGGLVKERQDKIPIYEKMAALEQRRAQELGQEASQIERAGLNAEEARMRQEDSQNFRREEIKLQEDSAIKRAEKINELSDKEAMLDPAAMAVVVKALGLPEGSQLNPSQLRAATGAIEAGRRQVGQETRLAGENFTVPSQATKQKMDSVFATKAIGNRYLEKLEGLAQKGSSYLERNIAKVLPATEIGQLQKALELFAVQVRNARENGVMTEPDFERYSSYLTIGPLDTVRSVIDRIKELQAVTDLSAKATLTSAKLGRENVSDYEKQLGITSDTSGGGGSGGTSPKTKQDFLNEARVKRGLPPL